MEEEKGTAEGKGGGKERAGRQRREGGEGWLERDRGREGVRREWGTREGGGGKGWGEGIGRG